MEAAEPKKPATAIGRAVADAHLGVSLKFPDEAVMSLTLAAMHGATPPKGKGGLAGRLDLRRHARGASPYCMARKAALTCHWDSGSAVGGGGAEWIAGQKVKPTINAPVRNTKKTSARSPAAEASRCTPTLCSS